MREIVYLNGSLIFASKARISPFDHGFLYGSGLFETMRAYHGVIFQLERHIARLSKASDVLGMGLHLASFDLKKACYDVLRANKLEGARIRVTISTGEGDIVPNSTTCKEMTVFIAARKLPHLPTDSYERGYRAIVVPWHRDSQSPLSNLKTSCYLENMLAKQKAKSRGADEAIFLNGGGLVAEGSGSNIFLVDRQKLFTPSIKSGVLPGITREAVLELAQSSGIETVESDIKIGKLLEAEEAFITSSIIEIMPLTQIEGKTVGSGKPGTITGQLMGAYRKLVADYCLEQSVS